MATEFTIDDVNTWLGCSREAGKKVWMDSDFYKAMTYKAIEALPEYFQGTSKASLYFWMQQSLFDHEATSYYVVWELQDNMKKKHKEGRKGYEFTDRSKFISYVKISASGALFDALEKHLKTALKTAVNLGNVERLLSSEESKSIEDSIDMKNDLDYKTASLANTEERPDPYEEEENSEEDVDINNDPEHAVALRICRDSWEKLLVYFEEYEQLTPTEKRFLSLMSECSAKLKLGQLGVIAMIEKGHEHLSFLEEMKERQGDAFNQNTYNSYMRRLRIVWRLFLESEEGKGIYEEFVGRYKACFH